MIQLPAPTRVVLWLQKKQLTKGDSTKAGDKVKSDHCTDKRGWPYRPSGAWGGGGAPPAGPAVADRCSYLQGPGSCTQPHQASAGGAGTELPPVEGQGQSLSAAHAQHAAS